MARDDSAITWPVASRRCWLVSSGFDLLLVANVLWPLVLLVPWTEGFSGRAGLQFWQVYFVTTPHRWITLAIVFLDRDQFQQRRAIILWLLGSIVLTCLAVRFATGTLTCLLTIDYLWNAWHFAAQHQGIYRIYGRLAGSSVGWSVIVERWLFRLFILYATVRVATATWSDDRWRPVLEALDWLVPVAPLILLVRDLTRGSQASIGGIAYLLSVSTLYISLLWSIHTRRLALALSLTTASAMFHALEYLAIVSWSVHKRDASGRLDNSWLKVAVSDWLSALMAFLLILGATAWLLDQRWKELWLFLNVIVAFLHYSYDGLIWRQRPVQPPSQSVSPEIST